jgi:hypothetical protein
MTLTELKQRMGFDELQTWEAYAIENGPMHWSLRFEAAVARAVSPFIKNAKPKDFMPWPREPEPEATPDALLLLFKNLASVSKRKH